MAKPNRWFSIALAAALSLSASVASWDKTPARHPKVGLEVVREEREVQVDGQIEVWRLVWVGAPNPFCVPGPGKDDWDACPCLGYAFGEIGDLVLVRIRQGKPEERLHLTPFFKDFGEPRKAAVLRRWQKLDSDDPEIGDEVSFAELLPNRPLAEIMKLADYDHDGRATEFLLQVDAGPCMHQPMICVGISKSRPYLHAFGTVRNPKRPLIMEGAREWRELLESDGDVIIVNWHCGDHGNDAQEDIHIKTIPRGIQATRYEYSCPEDLKKRKLKSRAAM